MEKSAYYRIRYSLNILEKLFFFTFVIVFTIHYFVLGIEFNDTLFSIIVITYFLYSSAYPLIFFLNKKKFDLFLIPKFQHYFEFSIVIFFFTAIVPYAIIRIFFTGVIHGFFIAVFGLMLLLILKYIYYPTASINFLIIDKGRCIVFSKYSLKMLDCILYEGLLNIADDNLIIDELDLEINLKHFSLEAQQNISNYIEELSTITLPPKHLKYTSP